MCTIVWSVIMVSLCVTVSLGTVPSSDTLKGLPLRQVKKCEDTDSMGCKAGIFPCDTAEYASRVGCCNKAPKVLLEGPGSLPKQMYEATRL